MNSKDNNQNTQNGGIDKFDGSFDQEESGCTIFINESVNSIKDLAAGGLYMYLLCRPKNWKLNIKHLMSVFGCGKNKIYKLLEHLISINLLTRTDYKHKGRFVKFHYRVHIRPNNNLIVHQPPFPCFSELEKPELENEDTYKTKNVLNKEKDNINIPDSTKSGISRIKDYQKDERFMSFYNAYPKKVDPKDAWKAFKSVVGDNDDLLCEILIDIEMRKSKHSQWQDKQFIKYPAVYLRKGEYLGELFNKHEENQDKERLKKEENDKRLKAQEELSRQSLDRERKEQELIHHDGKSFRQIKKQLHIPEGLKNLKNQMGLK